MDLTPNAAKSTAHFTGWPIESSNELGDKHKCLLNYILEKGKCRERSPT